MLTWFSLSSFRRFVSASRSRGDRVRYFSAGETEFLWWNKSLLLIFINCSGILLLPIVPQLTVQQVALWYLLCVSLVALSANLVDHVAVPLDLLRTPQAVQRVLPTTVLVEAALQVSVVREFAAANEWDENNI